MNMRKIIAVLAAVLMLCSVVPMSVFAADGDVAFSMDWSDGTAGFSGASVVAEGPDGSNCLKWTATGGWSATYKTVPNMDSTKNYTITMMAKGSVAGAMGITIQNGDWGSYWNGPTFNVTTEWQEVVITLPANGIPFAAGTILFKFQDVGVAMDLYVDDFVIAEGLPKVPLCENGDFETGDGTNWGVNQSTVIDTTAAYEGTYGAHLKGNGGWGSMLERTFTTEAGKKYELSFWAKAIASGTNVQVKDQTWQGASISDAGGWFSKTEWTQITYTFTAISDKTYLNFCGSGSAAEELYVDNVNLIEVKDPSFDGYITNGDFETGKTSSWTNLWGSSTIEIVEGGYDDEYAFKGTAGGAYNIVYQEVAVEPNTDYTIIAYSKDSTNSALWIKNAGGNGDIGNKAFNSGSDWALLTYSFNSGSNSTIWVGLMGIAAGATYTVDNIKMFEKAEESNDGYIVNGTFETGVLSPWNNLWGSCTTEIIVGGKDDNFALNIISGEWKHVRQENIAVEANTDYKLSVWAKDAKNMSLLVKDAADTGNIVNKGISAGSDWTLNEVTFNSGANTAILVSFMGGAAEAYGTFDNVVMEKLHTCEFVGVQTKDPTCTEPGEMTYSCTCGEGTYTEEIPAAHTYTDNCDMDCDVCGEWRDAPHNLTTHVEEVIPANCQEEGCSEYWICADCGGCFQDNGWGGYSEVNPAWLYYTGDHVRPEDAIVCAIVPCELCGEDTYGESCTRPEGDPVCQDSACVNCGETIWGWGCNYNTGDEETPLPLCQAGACVYCGTEYEYLYECENGAWAPCQDGECSYGCGKQYPATANHTLEDCTVDGNCSVCWSYIPAGEHTYADDFDVDCDICGNIREISAGIEILVQGGCSIREDEDGVIGLAAKFDISVEGLAIKEGKFTQADYTNATVNGYKLISMGVVASNGVSSVNIDAKYLCELDEVSASFAARIINIPADKLDVEITFQSYFIVEIDGEQVTIDGSVQTNSYNGVLA